MRVVASRGGWGWRTAACLTALALLLAPPAPAETTPLPGLLDARIRSVRYDAQQVVLLRGYVGYQIDLQFEPGETFQGLGAGDIEGIAYAGQDNHLFLKPKAAPVNTNLTVLTSRRQYQFEYRVSAQPPAGDDRAVIYALRFIYPPPPAVNAEKIDARRVEDELDLAAARRPHHTDYWYCGAPELRPVAAYDDGVHTRLRFAAAAELPAIFMRNEDGSESLVNSSIEADEVVVHRVAHRLILRRGRSVGCIVNRGYADAGAWLQSGTITNEVERAVKAGAP